MEKLRETLEHISKERDKALQELDRLKQHLLDKVNCFNHYVFLPMLPTFYLMLWCNILYLLLASHSFQ